MLIFIVPVEVGYELGDSCCHWMRGSKRWLRVADVPWMDIRESRYKLEDSDYIEVVGNRTYWASI